MHLKGTYRKVYLYIYMCVFIPTEENGDRKQVQSEIQTA